MFEQLRADRIAQVAAAESALAAVGQPIDPLRAQLAALQLQLEQAEAARATAEQAAERSNAALNEAQARVDQQQMAVAAAQATRNAARDQVNKLADSEPENPLPSGKPNPAYPAWKTRLEAAKTALQGAQAALAAQNAVLLQLSQARDAAGSEAAASSNAVAAAQSQIDVRIDEVNAAAAAIAAAEAGVVNQRGDLEAARANLAALDARQARLLAEPLNREELQRAANDEFAALENARTQRFGMFLARSVLASQRTELLAAQDQAVAILQSMRNAIVTWGDAGHFNELGLTRELLDLILETTRIEQSRPTSDRTDDLRAIEETLFQALFVLGSAGTRAQRELDEALTAVSIAAEALAEHQLEAP